MNTNLQNYKIINFNNKKKICYVFFSSNGIINNNKTLDDVIDKDYYEFSSVINAKKIKQKASKIILLRDLELNFYVNGINCNINSIEKILDFLRKETIGFNVIAVGYSAGGYMATICGLFLPNVARVFSFGGVFNLYTWKGSHLETSYSMNKSLIANAENDIKRKYYNIIPYIESNEGINTIFYCVYSVGSNSDTKVLKELDEFNIPTNFIFIRMNSKKHGGELSFYDYVALLQKPLNKKLSFSYQCYSKQIFSIKIQGLFGYLINLFKTKLYKRGRKNG